MGKEHAIIEKIVSAARGYQYDTFLIGAILPTQIYEREDAMRARLKIRGRESAKSQLTRRLGMAYARATRKKVDYFLPDLVINIVIDRENNIDVTAKSRPLTLRGRYVKKAPGLTQKQARCGSCDGKGCGDCTYSGLSGFADSVEGIIAKEVMEATSGQTPRFSWVGSEDKSSIVLGRGRPFYVKVFDPRKRKFAKIRIRSGPVAATLYPAENATGAPVRFTVKTRIVVRSDRELSRDDRKKLRSLAGEQVRFDNRSKIATKKIYSASLKKIDDRTFSLVIVADGGLMIKQFVGGEEFMRPNISELVGSKCDCVTFDILGVDVHDMSL